MSGPQTLAAALAEVERLGAELVKAQCLDVCDADALRVELAEIKLAHAAQVEDWARRHDRLRVQLDAAHVEIERYRTDERLARVAIVELEDELAQLRAERFSCGAEVER